jgi:hypothetical protein
MTRAYDCTDFDELSNHVGERQAQRITAEGRRLEEAYIDSLIRDHELAEREDAQLMAREDQT